MIAGKTVLAVIPARRDSKGLPGKNLIDLDGKPLIAHTIEAAIESSFLDDVIVSTDGEQIRDCSKLHGASVPFMRPPELAADDTPGVAPILHACEKLPGYDLVVVLQPTSPLRNATDIDNAVSRMIETEADFCVSVTVAKQHPNWLFRSGSDGFLARYSDEPLVTSRQMLDEVLVLNGAVYVARVPELIRQKTLLGSKTACYVMPQARSIDIDTALDLQVCEVLLRSR